MIARTAVAMHAVRVKGRRPMPNQLPPAVTCRQVLFRVLPLAAAVAACGDLEGDVGPDVASTGSMSSDSTASETTSGSGQNVSTSPATSASSGGSSSGSTASTSSTASTEPDRPPSDCNLADVQIEAPRTVDLQPGSTHVGDAAWRDVCGRRGNHVRTTVGLRTYVSAAQQPARRFGRH